MKTFIFSLVLPTRENTDVFITLDDNIYGIHSKSKYPLYIITYEPVHDKTYKMIGAPSDDSDQPGHPLSLISLHCEWVAKDLSFLHADSED